MDPDAVSDADAVTEHEVETAAEAGVDVDAPAEAFDLGDGDMVTRIAHAKQRHGVAGAMLAAGMLTIDQMVNGRKPREQAPVVVDASGEPTDIDRDGITVSLDTAGLAVTAPALPRTAPVERSARRGRRRRR